MLKLWCVLIDNHGEKFSVEVADSTTVEDVSEGDDRCPQRAYEDSIGTSVQDETFLGKKNGEWLNGAEAGAVELDDNGKLQHFEWMDPELRVTDDRYFGKHFQPEEGQFHVLVVIPKHWVVLPYVVRLQETFLRHALMEELSSTSKQSGDFKTNLITTYECDSGTHQNNRMLRCMLLDTVFPLGLVGAAHLFRRKNAFFSREFVAVDDIDDVRNGLLLFQPLKNAFDHLQISFIYEKESDEFRLKTFDPSLRQQRLFLKLSQDQQNILLQDQKQPDKWRKRGTKCTPGTPFDILTAFGDLEGKPLSFLSVKRPFKRCLYMQARLAREIRIGFDEMNTILKTFGRQGCRYRKRWSFSMRVV